jgi:hypothetical protein
MKALKGHTSFETAHLSPDFPAGFTKRVQRRVWVETKKGHGQRAVSNTSTDITGKRWCAPKASTYDALCGIFMVEDSDVGVAHGYQNKEVWEKKEVGHVHFMRVGNGGDTAFLERFNQMFGPFDTEYERETMRTELALARARDRRETEWKPAHPEPEYDFQAGPTRDAHRAWQADCTNALRIFALEELSRIKASDEVPEPKAAPVALVQEVPAGMMF